MPSFRTPAGSLAVSAVCGEEEELWDGFRNDRDQLDVSLVVVVAAVAVPVDILDIKFDI